MQQERNEYIITIITLIAIFGVICLCNHYKQVRKRMKTELQKVSNNYIQTYKEMQKANEELNILQKNADILIKKKEKEIKSLQASFQIYKDKYNDLNFVEKKQALINSNIETATQITIPLFCISILLLLIICFFSIAFRDSFENLHKVVQK